MPEPYYLRYLPHEDQPQDEVDLRSLGESLIGFSRLTTEFSRVLGIRGEITVSATHTREGSLIIETLIDLSSAGVEVFESAQDLYDFLKITSKEAWSTATEGLGRLKDGYENLEEYYSKHPIQLVAIVSAITWLVKKARKQKEKPQLDDPELPPRIAQALFELLKTKAFRRFLEPLIQDVVQSIELSEDPKFKNAAKIDKKNLQDYLPEEEQILPHLLPDSNHQLMGEVTSMKSTRGDSLTFHYESGGRRFNLDLLPENGKTTKAYTGFYKERIVTNVVVIRDSMYKKPKLRIETIDHQSPYLYLNIEDDEDNQQHIKQSS
jgi:hypothetical protein